MPDTRNPIERWRRIGRILPRDVRERIFEPAFYDVARAWLGDRDARGPVPFGVRVLWTMLGCVPIALPRLVVHRGRLTKLGRFAGLAAVGASILVTLLIVLRPYLGYGG